MADQHCLNCGVRLEGPFCHACGQPVKSMIRPFRSILSDALDVIFDYDSRIWRTLLRLYFMPGKVTRDYIAGRRAGYVAPFRLAFVSSVAAFLVLQLLIDADGIAITQVSPLLPGMGDADGVELVHQHGAPVSLEAPAGTLNKVDDEAHDWGPGAQPLSISWLPEIVDQQINAWILQGMANLARIQDEPARFLDSFLGLLPAVLFVLMPIFALLLKGFYLGTGRLYTEHMVVTLHSQSFLVLGLTVHVLLQTLAECLPAGYGVKAVVELVAGLALAWLPIYILIMQRLLYCQTWAVTTVKYLSIGGIYAALVIVGLSVAVLVTLVRG